LSPHLLLPSLQQGLSHHPAMFKTNITLPHQSRATRPVERL